MADVAPFRAVRYARPGADVVAPPYDVISADERELLLARDPHNVVHLTLNDSEVEGGRLFRAWLDEGVLVRDPRPAVWALEQDYVGPDGVARRRSGIVASLAAEPYERRVVLPHERTHSGPKESRLRLLRAARAQLEPIFLLHEGRPPVAAPDAIPDLDVEGTRLWRLEDEGGLSRFFAERELLIADGHHRYETALAYHAEEQTPESESGRMLVVLVSTSDPGLEIFATHRVFASGASLSRAEPSTDVESAFAELNSRSYDRACAVEYSAGAARHVVGEPGELDVELVDRQGHDGVSYTPDWREAVGRVDRGEATVAYLVRPTRIDDVFERARRGDVLPQKTTYFFPKLLSGLLFHPLDA
jgi:uncharacterized protein (DUF1015 family)